MPAGIVHTTRDMSRALELFRDEIIELLPRLRRFARAIARNPHDADDLVQITVERALRKFDQWEDETRLENWMFGIMRNAWIDEVRTRVRRDRVFAPEEAGENVGASSGDQDAIALQSALHSCRRNSAWPLGWFCSKGFPTRKQLKCSRYRSVP